MPTIEEELGMVNYETRPAIFCPELFSDVNVDGWYATSTEVPGFPDYVRVVDYERGVVGRGYEGYGSCVRPVRPSQC